MSEDKIYSFEFLEKSKILIGKILLKNIEQENAEFISEDSTKELSNQPEYIDYIMDVRNVKSVGSGAIGILMKHLQNMTKVNSLAILVMTEGFLQEIMLIHPEMFDFYAVFHTIEDAEKYIIDKR